MDQKSLPRCSYFYAALFGLGIGAVGAGCGGEDPLSENTGTIGTRSLASTNVGAYNKTPSYGITGGVKEAFNPVGVTTPVTFINGYATATQIYGIELIWGTAASSLYGQQNDLDPQPLDATDDPIREIKTCVDSNGVLTGVSFKTVSNAPPSPLILGQMCGDANEVAFNNIDDVLTNMQTWQSPATDRPLWGVKFIYTGPDK
jgi:hypothetical protein